ncbi:MFS transporter [Coxiella burnetii]|uniref:MFS transporter n=1 Tax=Coxiella burnetii TaxID=777 RepID=UPI000163A1D1|nr:MFS transporter [Coxiella burnetii]ATN86751.1 MFS transporter [Coxiella burnetii str. Schperling]EDR36750.1 major facilitator family transporter [Coxiella burnetii Q321]
MPEPALAVSRLSPTDEITYDYPLQPWVVCFAASLFFFFEFIQLNLFNALSPALMQAFHISATRLGHLSANYFYANVIFLFPAGMLLDRISTRKVIILAMAASVICTFGFAASTALWQADVCRFVTGIAGSFCLLSNVRLASRWFEPRRMALIIGLIVTFAMLGGMIAQTPFTLLTDAVGWRMTILIDAAFGLVMLFLIVFFVRDYPPGQGSIFQDHQAQLHGLGLWRALLQTIKNRQNWFGGLYTSLMNLPIFLLGAMWGILYLVQIRGLSRPDASLVTSMLFIGTIVGSPVIGWLSDRIKRRRMPMVLGAIVSLILILLLMYEPNLSFLSLLLIFLGLGFITSTQIISYPLIAESNSLALTGTAEGMASVLIMAGGFTQPFFARLMEWRWWHHIVNHVPIFSPSDYQLALAIMPIAFVLALVIAYFVRETHCISYRERQNAKPSD